MANNLVRVDNTRFIFHTNFSGDPKQDRFGSTTRKGNIILPKELADELASEGFNVKETTPREGEEEDFEPTYFISVTANYASKFPPKIYIVVDGKPVLLNEETVGEIDHVFVANVNLVCNKFTNQATGKSSLYIRTMYVEQNLDDDPYADLYRVE